MSDPPKILAYIVDRNPQPIEPAPQSRDWMEASPERFALRCLPLSIANASGWVLLNREPIVAEWNGGHRPQDVTVSPLLDRESAAQSAQVQIMFGPKGNVVGGDSRGQSLETHPYPAASGHFGCGVLTFRVGYLFRTPPGVNLWVKGPPNQPKDGIAPLEGIVETDWSPSTFTMNWKFTRPGRVEFERDEPICFIHPIPRAYVEGFGGAIRPIQAHRDEFAGYEAWRLSRTDFLYRLGTGDPAAAREKWQKDYFKGEATPTHQTKVALPRFVDETAVS